MKNHSDQKIPIRQIVILILFFQLTISLYASETKKTDLLEVVISTSDALIEHGRDQWGEKKTGLIASVLDRKKLAPPEELPEGGAGVRFGDRTTPYGSNVNMQQNLFRTFFLLSELTGDKKYQQAAEAALLDFITKSQSEVTHLVAWGEHLSYDLLKDKAAATGKQYLIHEPKKPLIFWDFLYQHHPRLMLNYTTGIWEHQIFNQKTGQFSRHARYDIHRPSSKGMDFTKEAGHFIDIWGHAYQESKDDLYAKAIETLTTRYGNKLNESMLLDYDSERKEYCNNGHNLTFLCDVWDAAARVELFQNGRLSGNMTDLSRKMDTGFLKVQHRPDVPDLGFIATCTTSNGQPRDRQGPGVGGYSVLWGMGYGRQGTAMIAMHAFRRANQLEKSHKADAASYRELGLQAEQCYASTGMPDEKIDIWPVEYGTVILMHLEAYRLTGDKAKLEQARRRAEEAVTIFWDESSPLPKSSRLTNHYETITGAETLVYALFSLHVIENELSIPLPFSDIDR